MNTPTHQDAELKRYRRESEHGCHVEMALPPSGQTIAQRLAAVNGGGDK
jgi:hypothetical protein